MKKQKDFILNFLKKEAKALSNDTIPDLEKLNLSVQAIQRDVTQEIQDAFPGIRTDLKSEIFYEKHPIIYTPRFLFKISSYKNKVYGNIWVIYTSISNPNGITAGFFNGYIISEIHNKLKIIGVMNVYFDEMSMEPTHWEGSVYNPSDLDIDNLGEFIETERYKEPKDDGFSMEDYLADK